MTNTGDIYVEVIPPAGLVGDLAPADLVEKVSGRVGELGQALASLATQLCETLERQLAERPESRWPLESVNLQLSINLEAEAGVVISRARTGAAFQASLTWNRREPAQASGAPG